MAAASARDHVTLRPEQATMPTGHSWTRLPMMGAAAFVLGAVASALLGTWLLGRALQPLDYTRRFQELLQEHNYAARLQQAPEDELAGLVAQFNQMLAQLHEERLRLGEQRGFLDKLLEATPSAVLAFDFDQRVRLVNASALALLGVASPEGHALSDWREGRAAFAPSEEERRRFRNRTRTGGTKSRALSTADRSPTRRAAPAAGARQPASLRMTPTSCGRPDTALAPPEEAARSGRSRPPRR